MKLTEDLYRWSIEEICGTDREWRPRFGRLKREYDGRLYHNWDHVLHVLGMAHLLAYRADIDVASWARIAFALFNHDRTYDPAQNDNEERSAERAYADAPDDEVRRLILLTKHHHAEDLLGRIVVDADLSILATPPHVYRAYSQAIRAEYSHLTDVEYRSGRLSFLEGALDRAESGRLFHSDLLGIEQTIANLRSEIARLGME